MEKSLSISKRVWNIVRFVFFMLHKGVSKRKLIADVNAMLKRGKNLMFHHRRRVPAPDAARAQPQDYEFSCSNTPTYSFPFHLISKKKAHHHHSLFACAHAPSTLDDDAAAATAVLDMLNNCSADQSSHTVAAAAEALTALSPYLPGFGRTPLVRPLRITDSPFPLREDGDVDSGHVDKAAEEFIKKFYKNLRQQKMIEFN